MSRPPERRRRSGIPRPGRALHLLPVLALAAVLAAVGLGAPPAAADGAGPTNYESRLERLEPRTDDVRVEVLGGDAFLQVAARPGVLVEVPGYDGEPYLRIRRDGVVEENRRSPAAHLNRTLDGSGPLPADADSSAAPAWAPTGSVGRVAWHDHRIHWMLEEPPLPGEGGFVNRWTVPLTVDGEDVTAIGVLRYRSDSWGSAGLALAAGLAAGAGAALLLTRGGGRWAPLLLVGAATVAVALAWASYRASPPDAGASAVPLAVAGAALLIALLAPALPRAPLALGAVALLAGWALLRLAVLWRPVVPSTLPGWAERGGTAAVLAVAAVTGAALVSGRSVVAPPPAPPTIR